MKDFIVHHQHSLAIQAIAMSIRDALGPSNKASFADAILQALLANIDTAARGILPTRYPTA